MRLFVRSPTNSRPLESNASACGPSNSPGPVPFLPNSLINFPSFENFTMRALSHMQPVCPSETKMSPFGATTTSVGAPNVSGPVPLTPALPSVIKTLPSGLSLKTCNPLVPSLDACSSVTHTFPCLSTKKPWGNTNIPTPQCLNSFPEVSNSRMGSSFESAQLFAPHRSYAHTFPSGPISTPAVDPHFLPSGNCAQLVTVRYGFGKSFEGGPLSAAASIAARHATSVNFT